MSAQVASPTVPDVRYSHRAVTMSGNMYVVGGINQFASPKRSPDAHVQVTLPSPTRAHLGGTTDA